ncbi:MAG: ribonuclease III family protein [Promethearchaeota archaeon]
MSYEDLLKGFIHKPKNIGTDKGLAQIGDIIVNLVYSIAKSLYNTEQSKSNKGIRTGKKVNQTILSTALKDAGMKQFARARSSAHDLADTVEAIVAYVWLRGDLSLNDMISIVKNELSGELSVRAEEIKAATDAFAKLLGDIKKYLPES